MTLQETLDVLGQIGIKGRKRGQKVALFCPFASISGHKHKADHTPSLEIEPQTELFFCFACLPENEMIWLNGRLAPIGSAKTGDCILDRYGIARSVSSVHRRTAKELIGVELGSFRNDPLRFTPDHTCLTVTRESAFRSLPFLKERSDLSGHVRRHRELVEVAFRKQKVWPVVVEEKHAGELQQGDYFLFPVIPPALRKAEALFAPQVLFRNRKGPQRDRL